MERSTLSVFVRGLTYRSPEMFAALKESGQCEWSNTILEVEKEYAQRRGASDPETFAEFRKGFTEDKIENSVLNALPSIFASAEAGQVLNNLHSRLIDTPPFVRDFLISDDPLARTNGILVENGHFALPISPRRLLVMTWKSETLDLITNQSPEALVAAVNRWVVESARHFVGARDRSQDRFIRNRFGRNPKQPISK